MVEPCRSVGCCRIIVHDALHHNTQQVPLDGLGLKICQYPCLGEGWKEQMDVLPKMQDKGLRQMNFDDSNTDLYCQDHGWLLAT